METVQIFIDDIPDHPSLEISATCDPNITWDAFLRNHGIKLNIDAYRIEVARRRFSFLEEPISKILDSYKRKPLMLFATVNILNIARSARTTEFQVQQPQEEVVATVSNRSQVSEVSKVSKKRRPLGSPSEIARKKRVLAVLKQLPPLVFTTLHTELKELKESGRDRVKKWRRYAPCTAIIALGAFDL